MKFSEMLSHGIWKNKPQTELEGLEELEKIKDLDCVKFTCEGGTTYGCIDVREVK